MLKQSELVPGGTTVEVPESYTILARRGPEVVAFENMKSEISGQIQGGMILDFVTDDHALRIRLLLAFNDERLIFDPLKRIGFTPDRASASCVRHEIQMLRFMLCVLSNGHVEVWDQERNVILGRSEGYLPLNAIVNVEFFEAEISRLNAILESSFPEE